MTHCFALERLGCDGLDWDPHRHRPALRCVGILQHTWHNREERCFRRKMFNSPEKLKCAHKQKNRLFHGTSWHLKATFNWPCCTVASAVSQSSSLFCRWEKTPQNEHRSCCRIASGSSPRTWRATRGRARGGWNASARHAPTGSS